VVTEQRILVFGGTGQLGRALLETPAPTGWRIITLGRTDGDVTEPMSVERAISNHKPTFIINASSYTAVDKAENEREFCMHVNRDGAATLARAAVTARVPLLHISTDYVFNGSKDGPWVEDDPIGPLNAYGVSKEAGEHVVRENHPGHVIIRTSWMFGVHGNNFVKTMLKLSETKSELRVVADHHGKPTDAADLARALVAIAARIERSRPRDSYGTFHFAGSRATTWFGFARAIFEEAARRGWRAPQIEPIPAAAYPAPANRPANSVLDCSRIAAVYGIVPRPWSEGLAACLDRLIGPPQENGISDSSESNA
jgi:dTDP-4-dehydrorhamnose reductase